MKAAYCTASYKSFYRKFTFSIFFMAVGFCNFSETLQRHPGVQSISSPALTVLKMKTRKHLSIHPRSGGGGCYDTYIVRARFDLALEADEQHIDREGFCVKSQQCLGGSLWRQEGFGGKNSVWVARFGENEAIPAPAAAGATGTSAAEIYPLALKTMNNHHHPPPRKKDAWLLGPSPASRIPGTAVYSYSSTTSP